jgi:ferric-dicitrate binding protein FerR (iron transport regulator)
MDQMNERHTMEDRDEHDIARVLKKVGARSQPAPQAAVEVRAAVEAEWRSVVSARQQRRRFTGWAAAAGIAVAAVGAWMARPLYLPEPATVATIARVVGEVQVESSRGQWTRVATGDTVREGTTVRTGDDGRAALDLPTGVRVRLDTGTVLAFNGVEEASMSQGAVYVDSGSDAGPGAARFVLDTPAGDVRHLGTQYEARLGDGELRVGIREGRIEVSGPRASVIGSAGELLSLREGQVTRSTLAPNASAWNWVTDVTPPFSIEGRTVDEFLTWAGRETGRSVVYASPEVERLARSVTLNGTVDGLPPQQAVAAVLATTSLVTTVVDGSIEVGRAGR